MSDEREDVVGGEGVLGAGMVGGDGVLGRRRRKRGGRPRGSGRAIPDKAYLLTEYGRVRGDLGRKPTQEEFAERMTDARDGQSVVYETLRQALRDYGIDWSALE